MQVFVVLRYEFREIKFNILFFKRYEKLWEGIGKYEKVRADIRKYGKLQKGL